MTARSLLALALALAPAGCLDVEGVDFVIDLASHTGRVTLHGLASDGTVGGLVDEHAAENEADDFQRLMSEYVDGGAGLAGLASGLGLKTWDVRTRGLVDAGTALDGAIAFAFAGPADLRLASYDRARPHLWCPPTDFYVARANASFRTREGCLVWNADVTVLRFELRKTHAGRVTSLLARWRSAH